MNTRTSFALLCVIFGTSICFLLFVYRNFPKLDQNEKIHIKIPKKIEDAKELGRVLSRYKQKYYYVMLSGVALAYVFFQSFAIPGSIFLSILSGFLFTFPVALLLVCLCSALGASLCYLLSYLVGRPAVLHYWPDRVTSWAGQVAKHRDNLLNYMLFLRITPFIPNWFINIAAPIIDVPLSTFFWGTFFGVAPPSVLFVQTGTALLKLTSANAAFSWRSILAIGACAVASLIPIAFKQRLKDHFHNS